ncbi:DeoR/GlpR family DNA-binding transcription regulator [Phytohabitans flavus]|uniref:DeoR family transcriptional regulator n=1 Tax=Phytohabitans flavus TaxID=1076124 RepID=A0A6F8XNE3_9ACTN|nr:DeoR/GlpR family DNA-binding transcription regulator [Phytohabitans flavus]BCB75271.1 DeoR family transcriptional regulator [Phytohabitans flavus]
MTGNERRRAIEDLLRDNGEVSVEGLATALAVTASTIRRDLAELTADKRITRTYGGAVITAHAEPTIRHRSSLATAQKDAIGRWAAAQVLDGETVLLDAGTTVGRLARHLRERPTITLVTNGLTALAEIADGEADVLVLGGHLRRISQGLVGPLTELGLRRLTADRAFLGADGLHAQHGICEAELAQTTIKEQMLERARDVYVLADSSKLGRSPFNAWTPLARSWTLVTDEGATAAQLDPFRALPGVTVVTVPID